MEHVVQAILDAGWDEEQTDRLIELWERRQAGQTVDQVAERFGVTTRTIYNWQGKLREVLARVAAPRLEEIRARADARAEGVVANCWLAIRRWHDLGAPLALFPAAACQIALRANQQQAELYGAIDRSAKLTVHATPASAYAEMPTEQLVERAHGASADLGRLVRMIEGGDGNGNGHHG